MTETQATTVKQLPMGISDFERISNEGYYYVDKTMFIPRLEAASSYLFLVRPRRFGKSLMLSMLKTYYDVNLKDRFQEMFRGLWIADHPTPHQGEYAVMHMDFSQVTGTIDELKEKFNIYCGFVLDNFATEYERLFYDGFATETKAVKDAVNKLNFVCGKAKMYRVAMYLIIDEYDNFTNTVLSVHGNDVYRALTHGEGFYRDIFKHFKPNFDRILMLGVSPVTMDDLTSGYNIATNITAREAFNHVLGFSEDEVRQMLLYYQDAGMLRGDIDKMIAEMKPWYDNYCFAEEGLDEARVFNSNMVLYYLNYQINEGRRPKDMADPNIKTDYNKMRRLIQLDKLDTSRQSAILQIAEQGFIYARLVGYFPASAMADRANFISLLYYYGMLTITGRRGDKLKLGIPNYSVRKQYYDYLLDEYNRIRRIDTTAIDDAFDGAAFDGDWRPLMEAIATEYEKTSAVRSLMEGERNIQGFFSAYLSLTSYYLTMPETELSHGYCDFFLMPDYRRYSEVAHCYIIELKYLKQDATDAEADQQWQEATSQITRYASDERLRLLCGPTRLHLVIAQFRGHSMLRSEEV